MNSKEDVITRSSFAGGCLRQNELVCVSEPQNYCDEDSFHSAHFLRANYGHDLRFCAYSIESIAIGRCGDNGECKNFAYRCDDPTSFEEYDPTCGVVSDNTNGKLTTYGRCNNRCVWSREDCLEDEIWVSHDLTCTSDKVEIGACMAGHTFCAVSSAMCIQPIEPYISHKEALETRNVNCILSEIDSTQAPVSNLSPTNFPSKNPTSNSIDLFTSYEKDNTSSISTGGIILICVAALLVLLLIALMLNMIACKMTSPKFRKSIKKINKNLDENTKEKSTKKASTNFV
mmetsp:Transcript_22690/g.25827  ORF Transcript_22690/g.25827 Transcript_22690/m.25827 type:complete len:287 (-) Transcript_22690:85-945(-)